MNTNQDAEPVPAGTNEAVRVPQPLVAVFFSPRSAFRALLDADLMWLPLAAYTVANIVLATVWLERVDLGEFTRAQLTASGVWSELTPERQDAAIGSAEESRRTLGVVSSVVPPLVVVLIALVFFGLFNLRAARSVSFRGSLGIVALAHAAVAMVQVPLTLGTMALQGDWDRHPVEAFRANPTLLLRPGTVSYPVYVLAQSLDLFTFWLLGLMIIGFTQASGRSVRAVAPFVVVPWVVWVAVKVAVTAFVVP